MQLSRIKFITAFVFTLSSTAADKRPDVEIREMSLNRVNGRIEVDTTIRNIGTKPINGLTAVYHFFAIHHQPITTQRITIDEAALAPDAETIIRGQLEEPARAITVEVSAVDEKGRDLRVKNAGPFNLE